MDSSLKNFIGTLSKEKDLDVDVIKEAIESALLSASKKNLSQFRDARPELNLEDGSLTIYVTKTVVPDGELDNPRTEISLKEARRLFRKDMLYLPENAEKVELGIDVEVEIDPADFGRIAAQSAKQIVAQRLRDAERKRVFDEYQNKVGQLVTGIVQRFEHKDVVLNIGRTEGVMPLREQPVGSRFRIGDRLKVVISEVRETPKGPVITLSRKTPDLVVRLFEQEVPEISDGVVKIIGVAREAGVRTKIAVTSSSPDVDPVGACVGMKGSRVQMVVRELENERIDIVPFSANPMNFIAAALNPAKIKEITLYDDVKRADVVVLEGNLAIAIGRKGQNTKLAARLTGWSLDIRSEEEEGQESEEMQRLHLEHFLSQTRLGSFGREALLKSSTYMNVDKIGKADAGALLAFTGDDRALAEEIIEQARQYEATRLEQADDMMHADAGEEESEESGEGEASADEAQGEEQS